ncbi:hypothetical protein MKEN_00285300 [Mycena kentingensis (nom. inval.)]|nr:hypothetical protein MKEN_00285300 [Mycena kentingensis (nom. inval.)]
MDADEPKFVEAVTAIRRQVPSFSRYYDGWPIEPILQNQLAGLRQKLTKELKRDAALCIAARGTPKRVAALIAEPEEQPSPPKRSRTLDSVATEDANFDAEDAGYGQDDLVDGLKLQPNAIDDLFAELNVETWADAETLRANTGHNAVDDLFGELNLSSFGPASEDATTVGELLAGVGVEHYFLDELPKPLSNKEGGVDCPVSGCRDTLQSPLPLSIAVFLAQNGEQAFDASSASWLCEEIKTAQMYLRLAEERHYLPGIVIDEAKLADFCETWVRMELPDVLSELQGRAGVENVVVSRFLESTGYSFWDYAKTAVRQFGTGWRSHPPTRPWSIERRGGTAFSAREAVDLILAPLASISYFQDILGVNADEVFGILMSSVDFGSFYHGTDEEDELARIDAEDIRAPSPDYSGAELDRHDEVRQCTYA